MESRAERRRLGAMRMRMRMRTRMGMRVGSAMLVLALAVGPGLARAQDAARQAIAERAQAHDDEIALRRLRAHPERGAADLRYLEGRLLDRLGRYLEAARAYPTGDVADGLPGPIREDARRRAAVALARGGRCAEAEPMLASDADDPLVAARIAECALARGDHARAAELLAAVSRRRAGPVDLFAARLELADALAATDRADEAATVLTALVVERPEHPEASLAWRRLEEITGQPPALSFDQRLRRVERLVEVRHFAEALEALETIEPPRERAARRHYLHVRGVALYRERHHYAEAAEVLAESAEAGGAYALEDAFHAARALSRADRDDEAVRAYRAFARAHPDHARAPEATYLAAWLELRHGQRGGERAMRRFLASRLARRAPALARDATWQLGLRSFEAERYADAERQFQAYAALDRDTLVRARGLYWLGRARAARGRRAGAIEAYREALYVEPLHWYALLSRQRLEELGEDSPPPYPEPPETDAAPPPAATLPDEVRVYASLGLRGDARDALRRHERALRREGGARAVAEAYASLGDPSRPLRLLGGAATTRRTRTPGPADRWRWDAAYPRPWPDEAAAAARAADLTPAHLYAVMRQESGFDPDAVSYADAVGLMQLLPSTAARVASQHGWEVSREMLFDPAMNLRLGAAYVGGLVARFGVPLAFAAFNAGGHRVDEWLTQRGEAPLDLFVERIPFEQTRNYIRRVTTHLAHYRYLSDPDGGWPVTLPVEVAPR